MNEGLLDAALLWVSAWIEAGVIAVIVGGSTGTSIVKGCAIGRTICRASRDIRGEGNGTNGQHLHW